MSLRTVLIALGVASLVPALAFAAAGTLLRREREDLASRICDGLAVVFTFLLAYFEIRHLLNGGDILALSSDHVEQGLDATLALAMAYVLDRLDLGRANIVFRIASMVLGRAMWADMVRSPACWGCRGSRASARRRRR